MKFIVKFILIAFVAVAGYFVYLGLTKSDNDNVTAITNDIKTLSNTVVDTFKDGVVVAKENATETIETTLDTAKAVAIEAKTTVRARASEIKKAAHDKAIKAAASAKETANTIVDSAREGTANALTGVSKAVAPGTAK